MNKLKRYLNSQAFKPNLMGFIRNPAINNEQHGICEVWKSNLEKEFHTIRQIVDDYNYVAVDTEFPGVVARPCGEFRSDGEYHWRQLSCNVNMLRIIQLGLTFMDENGSTPPGFSTWQFNFKFDLKIDMYAQSLKFEKHEEEGIEPDEFAVLLTSSGVVLRDNINFICFHSDYDFGYLLRILTGVPLPSEESEFNEMIHLYFPHIFDVKYMMKPFKALKGGLEELSESLNIRRIGRQHQAGSDALLTGKSFFKLCKNYFNDQPKEVAKYCGHIYGFKTLKNKEKGNNNNSNNEDNNDDDDSNDNDEDISDQLNISQIASDKNNNE